MMTYKEQLRDISNTIDSIQKDIASIIIMNDFDSFPSIINMTEKIVELSYKAGAISVKYSLEEYKNDTIEKYINNLTTSNGTVYADEELELKHKNIGYVYILRDGNLFRPGKTKDIERRFKTHKSSNSDVELFYVSPKIEKHNNFETELHKMFQNQISSTTEWQKCNNFDKLLKKVKMIESKYKKA